MNESTASFTFPDATQYAFVFFNAHLLLMTYPRDDAKFLFLIDGEDERGLRLTYPGRTFTDRVLDTIESIFFVAVEESEEETAVSTRYVLGSLFDVEGQTFGAYYERDRPNTHVVLFEVTGEAPDFQLSVPADADYAKASQTFAELHQGLLSIEG